ncbi:hypothetical protein D9758_000846 [Tetrapyrgos nigripes]|uniref:Chromo domain-containing protein n=1 Tax=Tetrapyrgos nigripes TaxID=182062 RepID=A0A8H5GYV1_9AGAR|nr:hypothetical protein D9758_000846 [Tetrapyrgos nigripes]
MGRSRKKARVQKMQEEEEQESDKVPIYEVEVITSARVNEDGEWEYYVKWHGYGPEEDCWEPAENVKNCTRLLKAFWKEVGVDSEDYFPGYVTSASKEWIARERKRAQKEFSLDRKGMEKRAKRQREEISKAAKKADKSGDLTDEERPKKKSTLLSRGKVKSRASIGSLEPVAGQNRLSRKRKRGDSDSESESSSDAASSSSEDTPLSLRKQSQDKHASRSTGASREPSVSTAGGKANVRKNTFLSSSVPEKGGTKGKQATAPGTAKAKTTEAEPAASQSKKGKGKEKAPDDPASLFSDEFESSSPQRPPPPSNKPAKPSLTRLSIPDSTRTSAPNSTTSLPGRTNKPASSTSALLPKKPKPTFPTQASGPASAGSSPASLLPGRSDTKSASLTPNIPSKTTGSLQQQSNGQDTSHVAGSSLSTKQRLFRMAVTPQNPREQFQAGTKKPSLSGLNFRKHSTASSTNNSPSIPFQSPAVAQDPRLRKTAASTMPPPASTAMSPNRVTDSSFVSSPVDDLFDDAMIPTFFEQVPGPQSVLTPPTAQPQPSAGEAENFLNSMVLPSVESDQERAAASASAPRPPGNIPSAASIFLASHRISKKWKWTGKIELQREDEVVVLCEEATLTDTTQVVPQGMPFLVAMPEALKSIRFTSFLQLDHLDSVLLACKPVQQLARLSAEDDAGKKALGKLARFISAKQLPVLVPIILDSRHVAQVVVFPPEMQALYRRFQVPPEYKTSILVAALLPWTLDSPDQTRLVQAQNSRNKGEREKDPNFWPEGLIRREPALKQAIRMLEYPHWLHSYMGFAERTFAIWSDEKQFRTKNLESDLLRDILKKYNQTREVVLSDSTQLTLKAVFVHISALRNLSKLPKLIELRSHKLETMFILFGGILTFTASVLVDDSISILEKINEVDDHKLWLGYLIPSVLGMAVKLHYRDQDPLVAFDNDKFVFHFLLTAIDEGKISLMRAPPQKHTSSLPPLTNSATPQNLKDWQATSEKLLVREEGHLAWKSKADDWIMEQAKSVLRGPREILDYCLKEFWAKYANVPETEWQSTLEAEISADLEVMQVQPAIMHEYRRFVVLKAERDHNIKGDRDGFEWVTCNEFKFRDQSDDLMRPENLY